MKGDHSKVVTKRSDISFYEKMWDPKMFMIYFFRFSRPKRRQSSISKLKFILFISWSTNTNVCWDLFPIVTNVIGILGIFVLLRISFKIEFYEFDACLYMFVWYKINLNDLVFLKRDYSSGFCVNVPWREMLFRRFSVGPITSLCLQLRVVFGWFGSSSSAL